MEKNSLVATRIRNLRLQKNLLQKYMANHLGISENAYSRIENGHTQITIEYLYKIAEALNCNLNEILINEAEKEPNNNVHILVDQINEGSFSIILNHKDFLSLKETFIRKSIKDS